MMDLDIVIVECDVPAVDAMSAARHLDGALRGIEECVRAECCRFGSDRPSTCQACAADCPQRVLFARQLSTDREIVRTHQKPSLPFSLNISVLSPHCSSFTLRITAVGSAIHHVELLCKAVEKLLVSKGISAVNAATASVGWYYLDHLGSRGEKGSRVFISGRHILDSTLHTDHARITITTPLRLMHDGAAVSRFDFPLFFRSQMRRCSSLAAYYGGTELGFDFVTLSAAADRVTVLEEALQYHRPGRLPGGGRGGITGTVECDGLTEPMFALLRLGSYFNAGKGAALGSGCYTIEGV